MGDRERISVVIPAYNAGRYLAESLQSVRDQSIPCNEIIVVDDGSTDDTANIARRFDVTYLYQRNQGVAGAMNAGFAAASGDFIASNDADDVWMPDKLAVQLAAFAADPELEISFGHIEQFVTPELIGAEHKLLLPERVKLLPGYTSVTMMVRRRAFRRVGGFSTAYRLGEFIDWYGRAQDLGLKAAMLDRVLVRRRLHGDNTGVVNKGSRSDYLRLLKASLDRRRRQAGES